MFTEKNMNMKKNIIRLCIALVASMSFLTSCDTDNKGTIYTPDSLGASFYWAKKSFVLDATNMSFEIAISRNTTVGAANITLTHADESGLFNIPSAVAFADGEGIANVTITASDDIVVGKNYAITLGIADGQASVSAIKSVALTVSKAYNWIVIGTGKWTDGVIAGVFGANPYTADVEVSQAEGEDVYRVLNPYGFGICPYTGEDDVTKNPCYIVINANDPDAVKVDPQSMGIDYGYGEMSLGSVYGNLSTNITKYPLGTKVGKTIDLGALYCEDDDGAYPNSGTILVLP